MINCTVLLHHWVPSVHENFFKIGCDNFSQLKSKIEKILTTIRTIDTQDIAEIEIELQLNGYEPSHNLTEWNNFIEFISSHYEPVLKFNLSETNPEIKKSLDLSYWKAVQKWHEGQLKRNQSSVLSRSISDTPASQSIVLESTLATEVNNDVRFLPLRTLVRTKQEPKINLPELQTQRTANSYLEEPLYAGFSEIINACCAGNDEDVNILQTMEACIGKKGLLHIFHQLSVQPIQHHLKKFIQVFFSSSEDAIIKFLPYLIRPEGQNLIQRMAELPNALYFHWLKWVELQSTIPNLKASLQKIYQLHQVLQQYNVKIPEKLAQDEGKFSERVNWLMPHLEPTHSIWDHRKHYYAVQAPQLLILPISVLKNLEEILNKSNCKWIRHEMLAEGFDIVKMDAKIPPPNHLAGFYTYAAQFMQDKRDSAFSQIEELVQEQPAGDLEWKLAAWCATLPSQPSKSVFARLKTNLNDSVIRDLYAIPLEKRMSVQDLDALLDLNMDYHVLFQTYAYLFEYQDAAKDIWSQVFAKKTFDAWKQEFLGNLCAQLSEDSVNTQSFKIFLLSTAKNADEITEVANIFSKFSPETQSELIEIFSSRDMSSGDLKIDKVQDFLLSRKFDQDAFEKNFPEVKFNYFKSGLDYGKVIESLVKLLTDVKASFGYLISPNAKKSIFNVFKIADYIHEPVKKSLLEKINDVEALIAMLSALKNMDDQEKKRHQLQELLTNLLKISGFFGEFINMPVTQVLNSRAAMDYFKLSSNDPMQLFFRKLVDQYDLIKYSVGEYLNKEKLGLIADAKNGEDLFQSLMELDLLTTFSQQINIFAQQKILVGDQYSSNKKTEIFNLLSGYIGRLPLTLDGFTGFFKRCEILNEKIKTAPAFEEKCVANNLDPLIIWSMLVKRIKTKEGMAGFSFWHMSDALLDCLIENKSCLKETGPASMTRVFETLLQCSDVFPDNDEHPHWNLCLEQIGSFIKDENILTNPMFGFVLKDSISYVLDKGKKYDFHENVKLFTAIGQKNPELMKTLQGLLAEATPENEEILYAVLEKTRIIFEKKNNLDGQKALIRILADNELVSHLKEINEILGWLLTHDNFAWSGLLAEDDKWNFDQLWALYQAFQNKSTPWSNVYQHMFPLKAKSWNIEPMSPQHEVHSEAESIKPTKPRNALHWVQKKLTALLKRSESPKKQEQDDPNAAQNQKIEEKVKFFWTIFKNYPYPSVSQLTQWLKQEDIMSLNDAIELFDKGDTGKTVSYPDEDINRWISEVECYNLKSWSFSELAILKARLAFVLNNINELMPESRQSLKKKFVGLKEELQQNPQDHELQDAFIATLCTAYYKIVGKVPYPTQILALLLNLQLDSKNLVYEIDTGEGKGVTIGLLALLKCARKDNNTVLVRTTTPDLVKQDLYEKKNAHFFDLFDVPSRIVDQKTRKEDFKQGGIYYSAGRDFDVFSERMSLAGHKLKFSMDVIVDELDSYLFDQNTVIKLTEENKEISNFLWIYPQINAYTTGEGDNVQALKQHLFHLNAAFPERIEQIQQLKDAQWHQWLMMSQRAKNLKENQDFVVRFNKKQDMYEAIPYDNGELKEGFSVGDPLVSGLQQFLHAHLSGAERQFAIVPETRLVSYLDTLNFKNVSSLVGLSGSIGGLPEVWEYQEAINANSARIGRFYPEKITKHPTLIALDEADMLRQIHDLATKVNQPLLILTDDIDEAQAIYKGLIDKQIKNKKIKILTGIEEESERRQWLHGNEGDFAKDKSAVTIATKVCSRGIDLTPEIKENVFVLEVGISEPRESKQKRGRTGRAGEEGSYQKIVNLKSIERQWRSAFNFNNLPLTKDTLPTYINKIQSYKSAKNHQKRMQLRLNDWAKNHVIQHLKDIVLKDREHSNTYFFDYYQHIHTWFMELPKEGMTADKMIEASLKIWGKVEALLKIRGKAALVENENNLEQILKDDKHRIYLLVSSNADQPIERKRAETNLSTASAAESENSCIPDEVVRGKRFRIESNVAGDGSEKQLSEQQDGFKLDEQNLAVLRDRLQKCKPEMSTIKTLFTYIFYFIPDIFQWLNPAATLTQAHLDSAWKTFENLPSLQNWKEFYRLLLSAKELHKKQSEQSIWHIDYWFDVFNKLRPWVEFSKSIERELEHLDLQQSSTQNTFKNISLEIQGLANIGLNHQPTGLIDRFMQSFQPLFKEDIDDLTKKYNAFNENPSADTLNELYQRLQKVQKFHEESQEWRSWRLDYWWYWQSRMAPWMQLAHELPAILEKKETQAFQGWKNKQKDISNFQLFYREYLICKEQLRSQDRRYASWFWGQENPLSKLESEYETKIAKPEYAKKMLKYEIGELARFFPKEAMKNYNLFQQGTKTDESYDKQQTMYLRVVDIMKKTFNPMQDTPLDLDVSSIRLQLFREEIYKWQARRDLIADINQRK